MLRQGKLTSWFHRGVVRVLIVVAVGPAGSAYGASDYARAPAIAGPALSVNVLGRRHAISPDIYGMNFYGTNTANYTAMAQELHLPVDRWGGNVTTRYNWQTNSFNSGLDYFFEGNPNADNDPALGQPSESDEFVTRDRTTN